MWLSAGGAAALPKCSPDKSLQSSAFFFFFLDELGQWSSSGSFCETAISRKAILIHWIKMEIRPQTSTFICKTVKEWKLSTPETESPSGPMKELNFPSADLGQVYKCGRQNSSRGAWAHFSLHPSTRDFFLRICWAPELSSYHKKGNKSSCFPCAAILPSSVPELESSLPVVVKFGNQINPCLAMHLSERKCWRFVVFVH